jgi:hypothetical protein
MSLDKLSERPNTCETPSTFETLPASRVNVGFGPILPEVLEACQTTAA